MTTLHIDGSPTPRKMRDPSSSGFLVFNDNGNENGHGSVRARTPMRRHYMPQTSLLRSQQTLHSENTSAAVPLTTSRLGNQMPAPGVSTQNTLLKVLPHPPSPSHRPYATVR